MADALAIFTTNNNDPALLPHTPFQILYADPANGTTTKVDGGIIQTGTTTFTVPAHTRYFVPVFYLDDSPPVIGTFPPTGARGAPYFFGPQVGGRNFAITVDGRRYRLGPAYVSRVVTTPPLGDGGGTRFILLGAFLGELRPGMHTVQITGGVFGAGIEPAAGIAFLAEDLTYRVTVDQP